VADIGGPNKKSSVRLPAGAGGAQPPRPPTGPGPSPSRPPTAGAGAAKPSRPPTTGAGAASPARKSPGAPAQGGASRSSSKMQAVGKLPTPGAGQRGAQAAQAAQAAQGASGVMAAAPRLAPRGHGSVAGRRVQGLGLAGKLSLSIAALVILVVAAWGTVLTVIVKDSSYDAIKRYGASAALCLGRVGRLELDKFKVEKQRLEAATRPGENIPNPPRVIMRELLELRPEGGGQPVMADIEDAIILYGVTSHPVASAKDAVPEGLKGQEEYIGGRGYTNVKCRRGEYRRSAGTVPALQFTVPIELPSDAQGGSAVLIISSSRVDSQVNSVIASAFIAGLFCVLVGIGVSYAFASRIVKPVRGLMRDMDIVSRGDFDHVTKPTSTDEIGLLALAFNDMTRSLQAARELEREAERVQGEINTTREIQAHLLPAKIPQLPGFDIFQAYISAKEVGGDYFDYIPVDRENLGIVVADVSGKGLPGAMVMAQTRAVLRMIATGNTSASGTLSQVNAVIARDIKRGMFVTMIYGILNVRQKTLTVASAGHNPMVLLRARTGQVELVNPAGIALGFDKGPIFNRTIKEQTLQLYKGDQVVLYTDGVVECMDVKHEEYTDERFYRWVQTNAREKKSRDVVNGLIKELESFRGEAEPHDDITVVTVRVE